MPEGTAIFNPFVDVTVRPAYGAHTAVIAWKLLPEFESGDIYIFRSITGNRDWQEVNTDPIRHVTEFSDTRVDSADQFQPLYYRLLLEKRDKSYDSPIVAPYGKLTPREYKHVRKIMNIEFQAMTRGRQGLRVWLYTPLLTGTPAVGLDSETGQQFSLGGGNPLTDSFGQKFQGGFTPPVLTYMKIIEQGPLAQEDMVGGESTSDRRDTKARLLAFPSVRRGDLVVQPDTDNRYVVGPEINIPSFQGIIPLAYEVTLKSLVHTDARYRVPVPPLP
jgi:hypothetical protein